MREVFRRMHWNNRGNTAIKNPLIQVFNFTAKINRYLLQKNSYNQYTIIFPLVLLLSVDFNVEVFTA